MEANPLVSAKTREREKRRNRRPTATTTRIPINPLMAQKTGEQGYYSPTLTQVCLECRRSVAPGCRLAQAPTEQPRGLLRRRAAQSASCRVFAPRRFSPILKKRERLESLIRIADRQPSRVLFSIPYDIFQSTESAPPLPP